MFVNSSSKVTVTNDGNVGIGTASPSGAKLQMVFSTSQSGILCYPNTYVYPGYSVLSTNGVIGTVKSGSGTVRLVDIRASEATATANGQVIGGYFQVDHPGSTVNINGGAFMV